VASSVGNMGVSNAVVMVSGSFEPHQLPNNPLDEGGGQ